MRHFRAILYKFVMFTIVLSIILGFIYGVDFGDILTISALMTLAAYIIGDLFILPRFGNLAATLADFGLAFFGIWMLGGIYIEENIRLGVASFLSSVLITIGELFFHSYLVRNVLNENDSKQSTRSRQSQYRPKPAYSTEIAEENYPEVNTKQKVNPETNSNQKIYPEVNINQMKKQDEH